MLGKILGRTVLLLSEKIGLLSSLEGFVDLWHLFIIHFGFFLIIRFRRSLVLSPFWLLYLRIF